MAVFNLHIPLPLQPISHGRAVSDFFFFFFLCFLGVKELWL